VCLAPPDGDPNRQKNSSLAAQLAEAIEQQTAASEVLEVIGRSAFESQPVFETVVRNAVKLCGADAGLIHQQKDGLYHLVHILGGSDEYLAELASHPISQGTGTLVGRVGLERSTVQIEDVLEDPDYQWHRARELGGFRTILGVPMLADERVVGVMTLWRERVDPFDGREIALVSTFAAQGAIAIQNGELFQELQAREHELARSVDELHALGEISQAVSSSLDLQEVLTTIVKRAVELSKTDGGSIFEFDPASGLFHVRTCHGTSEELVDALRSTRIHLDETFMGRAAAAGEARVAADLDSEQPDPHIETLRAAGWHSLVAVPLLREQEIIGALIVRRKMRGAVPARTVELLETLASQSAVAIHNARVFRQLEQKTQELEVAGVHKSEFLASMSHELRTPLNAVIGFSDVLLERMFGELNERQEEYLRDIRNSGRHLLELINELLDLSKVEAGRMELEVAALSLPDVIEQGLAMVRERASRHRISVEREIAADVGIIWADPLKLKQVVFNLLTNAVKFTEEGGSVVVTASIVGEEAHVSVRDTGVGIAEEERERIFEAFERGGRSPRTSSEGTGLGLTLSRRIVELHGGRLWMTSEMGVGSTFGFAIPISQETDTRVEEGALETGTLTSESAERADTILVVEDDRRSADLLVLYLEDAGFRVVVARDGVEGLELAQQLTPSALILDILLPRLDGWDLLTRLKAAPETADIPVVIVSMLDERGEGFALGASDYLVKPVGREQIVESLRRCIPVPGERRTVVAIDDAPVDLDLIEAVLAPEGYSVFRATSGEEGVAMVRRERPAVVLVDLLMPEVDGFAVVERLRADDATADVPIVVLTAKEMTAADRERLAGQISYLAKKGSFDRTELVKLVGRLASRRPRPVEEAS
jgi:signal transduction histidine kinase/CheY-like chemotaxis protein